MGENAVRCAGNQNTTASIGRLQPACVLHVVEALRGHSVLGSRDLGTRSGTQTGRRGPAPQALRIIRLGPAHWTWQSVFQEHATNCRCRSGRLGTYRTVHTPVGRTDRFQHGFLLRRRRLSLEAWEPDAGSLV